MNIYKNRLKTEKFFNLLPLQLVPSAVHIGAHLYRNHQQQRNSGQHSLSVSVPERGRICRRRLSGGGANQLRCLANAAVSLSGNFAWLLATFGRSGCFAATTAGAKCSHRLLFQQPEHPDRSTTGTAHSGGRCSGSISGLHLAVPGVREHSGGSGSGGGAASWLSLQGHAPQAVRRLRQLRLSAGLCQHH